MPVNAFVFDLDGTLLDTSADLARAINAMRLHYGLTELPIAQVVSYLGDGALALTQRSLQDTGISPEEAVKIFLQCYEDNVCVDTDFYPGMKAFIMELKNRDIRAGILTNKPQKPTDLLTDRLGISHLFDFIYGPDNFGKKPSPKGLLTCLEQITVPPEQAYMVGDHHTDMFAGNAAGVKTIFVRYGFGRIGESRADIEIDTAHELFQFL